MSNNNNSSSTIDQSLLGQPYKGRVKMVWQDGRRIQVPDLDAYDNNPSSIFASNIKAQEEYVYQKKLSDILTEDDKSRFKSLRTDEEKYDFVRNLIGGTIDGQTHHLWNPEIGAYVHGDSRTLEDIVQSLIDQKKLYMDSMGNLFLMSYAIQEHMIKFPCRYCSKVLYSELERRLHSHSHMARQQQR